MKTTFVQDDAGTSTSPLELLIQWLYRVRVPPFLLVVLAAISLTAAAGWMAVRLSQEYYRVAPDHYDSAGYRLQSIFFYKMFESEGIGATLWQSLQTKDSLDITLRLLFAPLVPRMLLSRF